MEMQWHSSQSPPHKPVSRRQVYSWIKDWEPIKLPIAIKLDRPGVPHNWVEWCSENCEGKWSWWFEEGTWDDMAYIGFELKEEAVLFKLIFPEWKGEASLALWPVTER